MENDDLRNFDYLGIGQHLKDKIRENNPDWKFSDWRSPSSEENPFDLYKIYRLDWGKHLLVEVKDYSDSEQREVVVRDSSLLDLVEESLEGTNWNVVSN